jgi:hypothetical protein
MNAPTQRLSDSPVLNDWLVKRKYTLGLVEATERELGTMLRASECDGPAFSEILDELRQRHFIMTAPDVVTGDRVRTSAPLAPMRGIVHATTSTTVTVDWGREQTPGVPGSRYTCYLPSALIEGALLHD